jgi:anthranilate synthase/aminodeoxychorismate synthase-like glutamine amidotransferase
MHGKTSQIFHDGRTIFDGLKNPFTATRYHSLVVSPEGLPDCLEVAARTEDGVIMALRHRSFPVTGVQFHPESILTEDGKKLLANFAAGHTEEQLRHSRQTAPERER